MSQIMRNKLKLWDKIRDWSKRIVCWKDKIKYWNMLKGWVKFGTDQYENPACFIIELKQ